MTPVDSLIFHWIFYCPIEEYIWSTDWDLDCLNVHFMYENLKRLQFFKQKVVGDAGKFPKFSLDFFYCPIQVCIWFWVVDRNCLQDKTFSSYRGGMTPKEPYMLFNLFYCLVIITEDCVCLSLFKIQKLDGKQKFP